MSVIDNAVSRLMSIAQACTTVTFKSAPDYPTDNVEPFPCAVGYINGGEFMLTNRTIHHNFPTIALECHFSRVNVKQAYQQINAIAIELPKRLAADPTLDSSIDTIVATPDRPVTYEVRPFLWQPKSDGQAQVISIMLKFLIPVKTLQAPQA